MPFGKHVGLNACKKLIGVYEKKCGFKSFSFLLFKKCSNLQGRVTQKMGDIEKSIFWFKNQVTSVAGGD